MWCLEIWGIKVGKKYFMFYRVILRIGSNVWGSVYMLVDKFMVLWDKVWKWLGNLENLVGCSCGWEYLNSEGVFYEDYFMRWVGRLIFG